MKIKRIKSLKVNSYTFKVVWDNKKQGAFFSYSKRIINIGTKLNTDSEIFMLLCHELVEIVAIELHVRLQRPDVDDDYIFVYDHRQHETMTNMLSGLLQEFI